MVCLGEPSRNSSRGQVCGGPKAVPSTDEAAACRDWCGNWVCGGVDVGSGSGIRADVGSGWGVRVDTGAQAVLPHFRVATYPLWDLFAHL